MDHPLSQSIISPQRLVHSLNILKLDMSQPSLVVSALLLPDGSLPLVAESLVIPGTETHAPSFENHNLDFVLALGIHDFPLRLGDPIALPIECGLVILRDRSGSFRRKRSKYLLAQGEIMCRRLTAMLEERIRRVCLC